MGEGKVSLSARQCPACGRQTGCDRGRKHGFQILSCKTCATLYTARVTAEDQEAEIYDSYYTPENLTVPAFVHRRLDEIVATFEPYRKNNRILDVGFGAGSFLEAAVRSNWLAFGVEVSETATEHVRNRGFEVFGGELDDAGYRDDNFDVVIASEVLEHVTHPQALLESIIRVLRPGGLLWATTPHGRGISARFLGLKWSVVCPPEHLQLFSRAGVRGLFTGAGFKQIELATHGTNPFEILHSFRRPVTSTALEAGGDAGSDVESFNRVESSYQLQEFLADRQFRRFLKSTLNSLLNAGRMGDTLKIRAEK